MLISVKNLTVVRGGRTLLSGIHLQLDREQVLHVSGRNGSGKTSLLETLAGLRAAECGEIHGLDDTDSFHWLGHRNGLSPSLSVTENLRFWCGLNGIHDERLESALDRWQIKSLADQPCRTLSVGQRRRASLARLLLVRRPLWLLDEPLSGLDAAGCGLFAQILQSHVALGGAALVSSHQDLPALPGLRRLDLHG